MSLLVTVPTEDLVTHLGPVPADVEVRVWDLTGPAPADRIDIVVPPYMGGTAALAALDGVDVGLVQGQSIGYDGVADALPAGVPFANAATVHEASTAELTVGLILAAQRRLPRFVQAQARGEWAPAFVESLADRRVLLVGFGGVGTAIARRLAPFEVTITAVARSPRTEHVDGLGEVSVRAVSELPALLGDAEIVVLSLPATDETHHLFDAEMIAAMAPGALLVNVGRGPLVDTAAMLDALHDGRIRVASDVFEQEPIPAGDPLWSAPGLLISPHGGGASTAMNPRIARLIQRQIAHLLAGEAPENIVIDGIRD